MADPSGCGEEGRGLRRDHGVDDGRWVCFDEAPVGDRSWSYSCDYCTLKVMAAFANGDMDDVPEPHRSEILSSLSASTPSEGTDQ